MSRPDLSQRKHQPLRGAAAGESSCVALLPRLPGSDMVTEVVDRREANLESGAEARLNSGAGVGVSVVGSGSGGCDRPTGRATLASATSNTSGRPRAGRRYSRIFIIDRHEQANEEEFLRICRQQKDLGIKVKC